MGDYPEGKNFGHGHVYPRPDGVKARCGGPGLCPRCSDDLARKTILNVDELTAEEDRDKLKAKLEAIKAILNS